MGYKLNKTIKISKIAERIGCRWQGKDIDVEGVTSFDNLSPTDMTFTKELSYSVAGSAVITKAMGISFPEEVGIIVADNPRLAFIKALEFLSCEIGFSTWQSPPVIDPSVMIGENVVIENGCVVGANTIIEHNVVLHKGTRVGKNSRIRSNCSIGGDGFGFERLEDGTPLRFPHLGGVVIGDNVEIGALNSIARGTLSDTVVNDNVKTDNLVHIAHNCIVGENSLITACAELSGGVQIGKNVWIGPNAAMMQKIRIGDNSLVGLGAVVTKPVPENTIVAGNPAKKIREI